MARDLVAQIRRATWKEFGAEEKIPMVLEDLKRGGPARAGRE